MNLEEVCERILGSAVREDEGRKERKRVTDLKTTANYPVIN